jgi:hypothetical protein
MSIFNHKKIKTPRVEETGAETYAGEEEIKKYLASESVKQEDKSKYMRLLFRRTFSTAAGRVALNQIMCDLQLNNEVKPDDVQANTLQAYAKYFIAEYMGCELPALTDWIVDNALSQKEGK